MAKWFATGAASGVPRGLRWLEYERLGEVRFDRRRRTALVPVLLTFEPIPGEGFDDVPQAREPRRVAVLFRRAGKEWDAGRAVFNVPWEKLASDLGVL